MNLIQFKQEYTKLINRIPAEDRPKIEEQLREAKQLMDTIQALPETKQLMEIPAKTETKIKKLFKLLEKSIKTKKY